MNPDPDLSGVRQFCVHSRIQSSSFLDVSCPILAFSLSYPFFLVPLAPLSNDTTASTSNSTFTIHRYTDRFGSFYTMTVSARQTHPARTTPPPPQNPLLTLLPWPLNLPPDALANISFPIPNITLPPDLPAVPDPILTTVVLTTLLPLLSLILLAILLGYAVVPCARIRLGLDDDIMVSDRGQCEEGARVEK